MRNCHRITEIGRLNKFDPVHGVAWFGEMSVIAAPDGRHIFRDRGRIRFSIFWGLARCISDSGFKDVNSYTDWNGKPQRKPKAEQIVFVAWR